MTEKILIVNADDFGWSRSVNRGIIECHRRGIVTSTSLMANAPGFEDAVRLSAESPDLTIGIHLNLVRFRPVLAAAEVRSLLNDEGEFLGGVSSIVGRLLSGRMNLREVEAEWRAQIRRVLDAGIVPTHLDSDKHLHCWPSLFRIAVRLAAEFGLRTVRIPAERSSSGLAMGLRALSSLNRPAAQRGKRDFVDRTVGIAHPPLSSAVVERHLAALSPGRTELLCHPGYIDEEFHEIQKAVPNRLVESRERERAALSAPDLRRVAEENDVVLTGFPR